MLSQARGRRLDGADVVIAVVETHGRLETDALTKGFETIAKKRSLYKGHVVAEMDLDAVLVRHPQLALVDELAHTNAQGSRHPKRYQDVEELLAAGIDVYTTVNIQHIESLNDVIAQITRIHVRETVPDEILDQASEIELVDTTPEDLLQRLREGKVYVKAQAERALKHFFSPGNLTALRELALRPHRDARRPRRDRLHAVARHRRAAAERNPRLRQRASVERRARAPRQAHRPTISRRHGPRSMSKAAPSVAGRAAEGPRRRRAAPGAAPGRGDRDGAGQRHRAGPCSTMRGRAT